MGVSFDCVSLLSSCPYACQEDSGWRKVSSTRVDEIRGDIIKGQWGKSTLAAPSLLVMSAAPGSVGKPLLSACDSRWRLANGKHSVCAWQKVAQEVSAQSVTLAELGIEGQEVLTTGLYCELVEYPSYEQADILMEQGIAHDAESQSNRFQQTSLSSKFAIIVSAQSRVAGGSLEAAVKLLLTQFGASKKGTFWRWAHMRETLPEEVRVKFDARSDMPQGFVLRLQGLCEFCPSVRV